MTTILKNTETPRLNELRNQYKKQKLENVFLIKETEFINQINDKKNNLTFIESLLSNDKTLEKHLINHKEKLENDIKNMHSNIRLIDFRQKSKNVQFI